MHRHILEHFRKQVVDYDTVADRVVMRNNELHETLVNALPFSRFDPIRVFDLGCGTGHGLSMILKRYPKARVVGIDFSDKMIQKSSEHLAEFKERIELHEVDFTAYDFREPCDAVVSAVAIHNITHEQKAELYNKIGSCLRPGGVFVNGDFIEGETFEINSSYRSIYERFLRTNLSGEELEVWLEHAFEDDKPMKLSTQIELLHIAGFSTPEILWQFNNEAVYIAHKVAHSE